MKDSKGQSIQKVFTDDPARQPEETDKSWEVFNTLLILPTGTGLRKLAKHLGRGKAYKGHLERWSVMYNWQARKTRHFNERMAVQQEVFLQQQLEKQEEFLRKEWQKADAFERYFDESMQHITGQPAVKQTTRDYTRDDKTKLITKTKTTTVEPHAIVKGVIEAFKLWRNTSRVAYGLPLDNQLLPDDEGVGSGGQLAAIEAALSKVAETEDYSEFEQFNQPKNKEEKE